MTEPAHLEELLERLEPVFDQVYIDGDDDELFAGGYLRGHFDLIAAQQLSAGDHEPEHFWQALAAAIKEARHELAPQDLAHVENMYQKLQAKAHSDQG